jgi:hypothetical protein
MIEQNNALPSSKLQRPANPQVPAASEKGKLKKGNKDENCAVM